MKEEEQMGTSVLPPDACVWGRKKKRIPVDACVWGSSGWHCADTTRACAANTRVQRATNKKIC
jgi:hypothetical protein